VSSRDGTNAARTTSVLDQAADQLELATKLPDVEISLFLRQLTEIAVVIARL